MKKTIALILALVCLVGLLAGCAGQTPEAQEAAPITQISNPWSEHSCIREAESAVGFSFDLPEVIADTYRAEVIRTMSDTLIEVVYRDEDYEVCVRKQEGEGQDISGDYTQYDTTEETSYGGGSVTTSYHADIPGCKQLISYQGFSWSLVAPNGYWGDSNEDFLNAIFR